jgi:hypothetical protein
MKSWRPQVLLEVGEVLLVTQLLEQVPDDLVADLVVEALMFFNGLQKMEDWY